MTLSRRDFLGLLALAGAGVACGTGGGGFREVSEGATLDDVLAGRPQALSLIVPPYEFLARTDERMAFVLRTKPETESEPIRGAEGRIWFAKQRTTEAIGPFDLRALEDGFNDNGIYGATVNLPEEGTWFVLAEVQRTPGAAVELGISNIVIGPKQTSQMPRPGDRAIAVATPTVANARGVDPICTREPRCTMHRISLDDALDNGKPTVLIIGTPRFCTSRFCGPEVDIVEDVASETTGMNFIHMEVLKDDDAGTVAAFTGSPPQGYRGSPLAPGPIAWKLSEEPVIYFIDARGVIQARLVGAVDGVAIRETLDASLEA